MFARSVYLPIPSLVFCIVLTFQVRGQTPFIQNYPPEAYRGASQNWDVIQGKSGIIYVANNDGVLQYDGLTWRLISLPNKVFAYALTLSPDGKIYVGATNELGYLSRDSSGQMVYASLKPLLDKKVSQIKTVDDVHLAGQKIVFQTREKVFIYEKGRFEVFSFKSRDVFVVGKDVYFRKEQKFLKYHQGKLISSDLLADFTLSELKKIVLIDANKWLLVDYKNQFWLKNKQQIQQIYTPFTKTLGKRRILNIQLLSNERLAITLYQELFILDKNGEIVYQLNQQSGLINTRINNLWEDHQNNIWLATNYGVAQLMINAPITQYTQKDGFLGTIYSLGKHRNYAYVGTNRGVFFRAPTHHSFKRIPGIGIDNWNFYNFNDHLYLANGSGVYEINDSTAKRLARFTYVHALHQLHNFKDHFIVGTYSTGIWLLKKEGDQWVKSKIKGFEQETRFIQEDELGNLWIAHYNKGIYRLTLNTQLDSVIQQDFYDETKGLPSNKNNRIYRQKNGQIVATTTKGFYLYNFVQDRFIPMTALNTALKNQYCVYTFQEDTQGNIYCWLGQDSPQNQETAGLLQKQANGSYKLITNTFNKISVPTNNLRVDIDAPILVLPDGKVWIGNLKKLRIYHPKQTTNVNQPYRVIIRQVQAEDSIIFRYGSLIKGLRLPYTNNNIRIDFSAITYENIEKTKYSYQLSGFQAKWSKWSSDSKVTFTNLPEGKYTLRVKAKNSYNKESLISSFAFEIRPPWHRTWWAYTLYVVGAIVLVFLIVRLNSMRLIKQKMVLERTVQTRTEEIRAQNEELKQNQDEILAQRNYIEDQNKHLVHTNTLVQQSIKSALTIQEALLPFHSRISQFLRDYFVIYLPKDIVSGDFYWIEKIENKIFVIAADCTGHGVPGAFMSLIGHNLFDKIILQQGYHDPAIILDQLHQQVAKALKQPDINNISGMDTSIIVLEPLQEGTTQITFAGARRPLYYVSSEDIQNLQLIKGTRRSIGGIQNTKVAFENHVLTLPQNSILFMGSDGLTDQNNKERKKFGVKRLEKILQHNAHLPLDQQQAAIEKALENHMLGTTQRDDILWMGIRI
ncbi:hypothetical protein BKI52_04015 [marine bacterium AO1-C]|nr:hypothetical protein BKI52_04015 [marine bacterium AO1-C]